MMADKVRTPLRLRLIVAFLLVSVPPMLIAAYAAAGLINVSVERNVQKGLGEAAKYIRLQIQKTALDSERSAKILAKQMENDVKNDIVESAEEFQSDIDLLNVGGFNLVVIWDERDRQVYSTSPGAEFLPRPSDGTHGVFTTLLNGQTLMAAGAAIGFHRGQERRTLFVGNFLEDDYFDASNVAPSLDLQVFRRQGAGFVPILKEEVPTYPLPSADMIRRLQETDEPTLSDIEEPTVYEAVYIGIKDVDGKLIGAAYVGLSSQDSFFERIGLWQLLLGIFFFGSAISIGGGLWMSGLLVRPLDALTRGVRAIAAGDYRMRVPIGGSAETSELAGRFNDMAAELERLHAVELDMRRREKLSALGEAAMVIAHEVRNPLGIIKSSADLVRSRGKLTPEETRLLGYVSDEVQRIERLVRSFLEFAKPQPPHLLPVKLDDLIARLRDGLGPELTARHIALKVQDDIPGVEIRADRDQIHQALLNLALNAIDAMPEGGTIEIVTERCEDGVAITVADDGPGISDHVAERLFNPFFTTKAKGTGLGLARVQSIMEAHGGRAELCRDRKRGTAFRLVFPPNPLNAR